MCKSKTAGIEDLYCHCPWPDKYTEESGISYCHQCGGITDKRDTRAPEEIAVDWMEMGPAAYQCSMCGEMLWIDHNQIPFWMDAIKKGGFIKCGSCRKQMKIPETLRRQFQ